MGRRREEKPLEREALDESWEALIQADDKANAMKPDMEPDTVEGVLYRQQEYEKLKAERDALEKKVTELEGKVSIQKARKQANAEQYAKKQANAEQYAEKGGKQL